MKYLTLLLFLPQSLFSQQIDYNTKKGFVAEGYDVVSYFTKNAPLKGNKNYEATF